MSTESLAPVEEEDDLIAQESLKIVKKPSISQLENQRREEIFRREQQQALQSGPSPLQSSQSSIEDVVMREQKKSPAQENKMAPSLQQFKHNSNSLQSNESRNYY